MAIVITNSELNISCPVLAFHYNPKYRAMEIVCTKWVVLLFQTILQIKIMHCQVCWDSDFCQTLLKVRKLEQYRGSGGSCLALLNYSEKLVKLGMPQKLKLRLSLTIVLVT